MKWYGEFLGKRYRDTPNIKWIAGGDHNADGEFEPIIRSMIEGIQKFDQDHFWSGHFDNTSCRFWSTDNPLYRDLIDTMVFMSRKKYRLVTLVRIISPN